jgi:hypothetical protein
MTRRWSRKLLILISFYCAQVSAKPLFIDHDVPVFATPELSVEPLLYIKRGDSIVPIGNPEGGYRRVRIRGGIGYVAEEEFLMENAYFADEKPARFTVGILTAGAILTQGSRKFQTVDQTQYSTTRYDGSAAQLGCFLDFRFQPAMAFRFYASFQKIRLHGYAIEIDLPVKQKRVDLNEDLYVAGVEYKYYILQSLGFWLGGGLEFARGVGIDLTLDGIRVPTFNENLPNLLQALVAVGFDVPLWNWVLGPELRYGEILTAKPPITSYDLRISIGRHF